MFNDVVDPQIKVGGQKWYTVPLSMLRPHGHHCGHHHHPADGDGRDARGAVDDGLRGGAATATTPAATAAAPGGRAAPQAARPGEPQRGPDRGAEGNPQGIRHRHRASTWAWPAASRAAFPAVSSGGVVGGLPEAPPPPPPPAAPVRVGGNIKAPVKTKDVRPTYPADRAVGARPGDRHHRSHHRPQRQGGRRQGASVHPAARQRGARCRAPVGVHADAAQRRARTGHHDRHRSVHAAVARQRSVTTHFGG